MEKEKRVVLRKKGWRVGSVKEFLNLTPDEEEYVELKVTLAKYLQQMRVKRHLTQVEMAQLIKSSQSRVAKMEGGEESVTIDLIIRSLFALGSSKKELAKVLS